MMDETGLALKLLFVLSCDLCIVLEDIAPLVATLDVLAINALTVVVASDASLETLTVLLEAFGLLAVAALRVPLLIGC